MSLGYPYVLNLRTTTGKITCSELRDFLKEYFANDISVEALQDSTFTLCHGEEAVGDWLHVEQPFKIGDNIITVSCPADEQDNTSFEELENLNISELENLNISSASRSAEIIIPGDFFCLGSGKVKMDDLKPHEREILFKSSKFKETLAMHEVIIKHKSPVDAPVLKGPPECIRTAECEILKFLRKVVHDTISVPVEAADESMKLAMQNKIISSLEKKFQNDPVSFEITRSAIVVYSIDSTKPREINKYIEDNFLKEYFALNNTQKFEYIKDNHSDDIKALSMDGVWVFPTKTSAGQGYTLVAFENKKGFDDSKATLQSIIKSFQSIEVNLNCSNVSSERFEIFQIGVQNKWKVILNINETQGSPNKAIIKGITVSLIEGKIENQNADVLVNSTSAKLNLSAGEISKAICEKAGPGLQKECSTKGSLSFDKVIETKGYNLECKSIFHCLAKEWNSGNPGDSKDILMKIVTTCFDMAINNGFTSIAFPPIACGVLKMPAKDSAESIFDAIENYNWPSQQTLKDVRLVIYDPVKTIWHVFQKTLHSKISDPGSAFKGTGGVKVTISGTCKDNVVKAKNSLLTYR